MTGTFNNTFYVSAEDQLKTVQDLAAKVEPEFLAKLALHARTKGLMKDTPAYLAAHLAVTSPAHLAAIFGRVIDNGKQLRNFVQFMRSGVLGRKSIPRPARRLIRQWLLEKKPT